jgi:predicted nuclease with TOPRIM domain
MFGAIKLIIILSIIGMIGGGLWYITNLKADLAISELNSQRLEEATKQQNMLIEQMQNDIATIQKMNSDLQEQNAKQQKDVDALAKKFDKRDFGSFVASQPEKSEQLINRGTKNVFRCLELASGAPLNETEKTAKTPTEANRECPNLIDSDFSAPSTN